MSSVKDIIVKVIPAKVANDFVRKHHYSGKVVNNSKLHFGAFLNNRLHGVMSFGSPLDKRKVLPLVKGTLWNEMLELNRMAFDDTLPKNSESRCIAIAIRLLKKNAPHIKWVLSFADGTQCGDGTIYRAAGFVLTSIKKNTSIWEMPDGEKFVDVEWKNVKTQKNLLSRQTFTKGKHILQNGGASMKALSDIGAMPSGGYQLRYVYLIDKTAQLTVPVLPFSEIERRGAGMYKGKKRVTSIDSDATGFQSGKGGANPTVTLQT